MLKLCFSEVAEIYSILATDYGQHGRCNEHYSQQQFALKQDLSRQDLAQEPPAFFHADSDKNVLHFGREGASEL